MEIGVLRQNYKPLFKWTLKLVKNSESPGGSTIPENADVHWSLEYKESDNGSYLRIGRYGNQQVKDDDKFGYYHLNINAPNFAHFFEYFFFVGTSKRIPMPKLVFDEEKDPAEPITVTCVVSKRATINFHRAQCGNTLSETLEWFFPVRLDVTTWKTGFSLMWRHPKEPDCVIAFEVAMDESGRIHFQTEEALPVDVRFWGYFKRSPMDRSLDVHFDMILKRGELRVLLWQEYFTYYRDFNLVVQYMYPTIFIRPNF